MEPAAMATYDVFINHRGPDVKSTLARFIYDSLKFHGLTVFLDQEELHPGDKLDTAMFGAIESASVHVAIFSERYAESSWCLEELCSILKCKRTIIPVFYDVDPADLRHIDRENGRYKKAFEEHHRKGRVATEVIQKWKSALEEAAGISGIHFKGAVESWDRARVLSSVVKAVLKALESAPPRAEVLLQPLPESGFVGSGIVESAEKVLRWINEPDPQGRVIGVYGMAGVGKTSLLQLIHNKCKEKVSSNFDYVIWFTVSQNYKVEDLQDTIAESVGLDIKGISSIETRKMKLYASLKNMRFLLILDDLWSRIDLNQDGVNFGHDSRSRVLISSRSREVVHMMAAKKYSMMIRPLSPDEGWELFRRRALTNGDVPEAIAKEVASECKGLPLAINVVAAAMALKDTADEWSRALDLMRNVDPSFPPTHSTIDAELYQRLRWSYNDLPDNLKMCFLYCSLFPEDAWIEVERLVEMWAAEGLVLQKGRTYFMDAGRECVNTLVNRCLIEYESAKQMYIKVHDVLRDMGIYIGQGDEEKWLFLSSQRLKIFPSKQETTDCKRISLVDNEITDLSAATDLKCPTLVSLVLAQNRQLKEIPEGFLVNFISLKVLDLSWTSIGALPASVGQLGQLRSLNLRNCYSLRKLPNSICNLSHLQILNLEYCFLLKSLPDRIGELKNLKALQVSAFDKGFKVIPHQISQLTSLNKLALPFTSTLMSVDDLTNLSNLIELNVTVKPEIRGGSMSTWSEMRKLRLDFHWSKRKNRDDAALDILPQNMQSMKKLEGLSLDCYKGASLPNCICQFQYLKMLCLECCRKLKELPTLANGSDAASGSFPMLERLRLYYLDRLESIVCNEGTMSKLQILEITACKVLKTFRMDELPNLRYLRIDGCPKLKEWSIPSGGFPMLETLELQGLAKLESVAVRSSVWSEETMPKLQVLVIKDCLSLRRLAIEKLPNVKEIKISHCPELQVEIGNLLMLETMTLERLKKLESIASVWNEKTMPKLEKLRITSCPLFRVLPLEMDKLPNLREIVGKLNWWEGIIWEDQNVKIKLTQLFREEETSFAYSTFREEETSEGEESEEQEDTIELTQLFREEETSEGEESEEQEETESHS